MSALQTYNVYLRLPAEFQSKRTLRILRRFAEVMVRFKVWQAREARAESRVSLQPVRARRGYRRTIHDMKYSAVRTAAPPA
jgi:hypothetical protein